MGSFPHIRMELSGSGSPNGQLDPACRTFWLRDSRCGSVRRGAGPGCPRAAIRSAVHWIDHFGLQSTMLPGPTSKLTRNMVVRSPEILRPDRHMVDAFAVFLRHPNALLLAVGFALQFRCVRGNLLIELYDELRPPVLFGRYGLLSGRGTVFSFSKCEICDAPMCC